MYTPTRVMPVQRNAAAFCQSRIQPTCEYIFIHLLLWLGDILIHDKTLNDLIDTLDLFFRLCRRYNLKLQANNCKLFFTKVRCCGRIISGEIVEMDPSRPQALPDMPFPSMGEKWQQFVFADSWIRSCIPQFAKTIAPLADHLEFHYQQAINGT